MAELMTFPSQNLQLPVLNPDRPIYNIAGQAGSVLPYVWATGSFLNNQGSRSDKLRAGTGTLGYFMAFRFIDKLWDKGMRFIYDRNPKLAEKMNQHRILFGLPVSIAGFALAVFGARKAERFIHRGFQTNIVEQNLQKALHNKGADAVFNKAINPASGVFQKVTRSKYFVIPAIIGSVGLIGLTAFRSLQDNFNFSRAYKEARKDVPLDNMSPYDLRNQVLLNQYY